MEFYKEPNNDQIIENSNPAANIAWTSNNMNYGNML